ncbi:twin arginine translocase protein A [Yersinia frederiksenii]|uniref:Sec-independent protein translocase subunit TatA n=1 Tax=Yersinia frederiksenii TaxID=29484 RepID=UPI0005E215AD|nr:Sec-independent protein translocase subunit TatA [Yersinia frederiksenii]CFR12938.1 twin arginine translocase protein A [Yersinia frederiksenii]CNC00474.1 twin arginine translocase protein A [Yersinia frederiksenii]
MEGISITKLLVVGILIVLLFGTSKLRTLGADLGAALKGFKKAMGNDDAPVASTTAESKAATDAKTTPPLDHKD